MTSTSSPTSAVIRHRTGCDRPGAHQRRGARGDDLLVCDGCGSFVVIQPEDEPDDQADDEPETRPATTPEPYALTCLDCDRVIWCASPRPRIPLCGDCKQARRRRRGRPSTRSVP